MQIQHIEMRYGSESKDPWQSTPEMSFITKLAVPIKQQRENAKKTHLGDIERLQILLPQTI